MSILYNESNPEPMTNPKMSFRYVIEQAIDAEDHSRNIYVQFSQMFYHVPDVSGFWQGLAYDEAKHACTLKKTHASLTPEQLAIPADRKLLRKVEKTNYFLSRISLDAIRTLDDAYEIAHEIEFSELNYIFKFLAEVLVIREEARQILFGEIEEHQKKLTDFTENFGDRSWRRQILVRSFKHISSG